MSISDLQQELRGLKELQSERQKRLKAKNDLLTYASIIDIPNRVIDIDDDEVEDFEPIPKNFGKHHILWLDCLQQVADGKIKRLMGLLPPGSGKSVYTSVCFPTWFLGRFPRKTVLVTSYGSELPQDFGRWARTIVKQPLYKRIFGAELSSDSKAVDKWTLTNGSEFRAAGILSGITGKRADGVIWDDLIRGREDADSPTVCNKTWGEYVSSLRTRKRKGAWEIGVNTRWSENDPPGHILPLNYNGETGWIKGQDGFDWYVVCLPMVCEREDDPLGRKIGDWLWPEYFERDEIEPVQRETRTWSALYQQRPAPESGSFFKADWFRAYGEGTRIPEPNRHTLHVYGASDYAVTDEGGNYTVHVVAGVDPTHDIYILDLWRQRTSPDKWVEALCNMVEEWRPMGWAEEMGQIKSGVGPFLHKRLMERQLYIPRVAFPARGDKQVRATSINGRMGMGKVYFPTSKSWFPELKRELLTFPAGKTDDQVDACLAEDTLVLMADGNEKLLKDVKVGDFVSTPIGPKKVLVSVITNFSAKVFKVSLSNGKYLIATGDHPIFVEGKGFTRVDTLDTLDQVHHLTQGKSECLNTVLIRTALKLSNIMIAFTGDILEESIFKLVRVIEDLRKQQVFCIDMYGKILMAPYQKDTTFITKMKIEEITTQKILIALPRLFTEDFTQWWVKGLKNKRNISSVSEVEPVNGIGLRQGVRGTKNMLDKLGVLKNIRRYVLIVRDLLKGMHKANTVQEDAVVVTSVTALEKKVCVRNLTVQDANVFFANRILVHNCGLLGQILDRMVSGSPYNKEKDNRKVLSMDPNECSVTLDDMWEENERKDERLKSLRIR